MLSNKFRLAAAVAAISMLALSCGERKSEPEVSLDLSIPENAKLKAGEILETKASFGNKGFYDRDSVLQIAAGVEIETKDEWGIKFYHLKQKGDDLKEIYSTDLLNGSFKGCLVNKIKFPAYDYELVYYNSKDYFLGSGGGEVFSYIIDLSEKQVYYAHLISETGKQVLLYLSENIRNPDIRNFFTSNFKRDFPDLRITKEDVKLEF